MYLNIILPNICTRYVNDCRYITSLLRNSVFNCGENPYTSEYKKVGPNNIKKKIIRIVIFNIKLSNTLHKNFL